MPESEREEEKVAGIPVMLVDVGIEYGNLAVIQRWHRTDGEQVCAGDLLLEVETAKAQAEVLAPAAGTLRILAPEGAEWDIANPVASIGDPETASAQSPSVDRTRSVRASSEDQARPKSATSPRAEIHDEAVGELRFVRSSPGARKLAREYDVPLEHVSATGPLGRVIEADVRTFLDAREAARRPAAASATAAASAPRRHREPLSRVRRMIADRMRDSVQRAAHVTLTLDVDMEQAAALRHHLRDDPALAGRGEVSYTDLVVKSAARALCRHPLLNACLEDDDLYLYEDVNVGVGVAVEGAVLVAVLHYADRRPLLELSAELRALAAKAREGRLSAAEMSGATFTVTNLGAQGIDAFTPIIHQPASAILGVGVVRERVVARGGQPQVRLTAVLSLSFDHRVLDGVPAAAFLAEVRDALEHPYRLLLQAETER